MAIKGKSKSKKAGAHRVARAPKQSMEKPARSRRRLDLNAITVLGGLFVITMVVILVWALVVTLGSDSVEGVDEYNAATIDVRNDLESAGDEFLTLADEIIATTTDPNAAADAAQARIPSLETGAATVATTSAGSDFAAAQTAQENAARLLQESAATLALMRDKPADLASALAKKSARQSRDALALLDFGTAFLLGLEAGSDYEATGSDVGGPPPPGEPDPYAPAPPLDGLGTSGTVPAPAVNTDMQSDAAYANAVSEVLTRLDSALANMGDAVTDGYEATGDATVLQQQAVTWADALRTAINELAATARPETIQGADVLLRNSLWIWLESVRSFGSISVQPDLADALLDSGKALRLIGDEPRAFAAASITAATDVSVPAAPDSGFPATALPGSEATDTTAPVTQVPAPQQGQ